MNLREKEESQTFSYSYTREIVGYQAYLVFERTTELAMRHFAKLDLTTKEGIILEFVANNPNASQIDIARKAGMKGPYLVKILDNLTQRGLLIREPSPVDRRRHRLKLTEAGEALRDDIQKCHLAGNRELFAEAGLSDDEAKTLLTLLNKITDSIKTK